MREARRPFKSLVVSGSDGSNVPPSQVQAEQAEREKEWAFLYGLVIHRAEDPLTNLRFADDVLLFASNPSNIFQVIHDLSKEASEFGLKLHMGKTVLANMEQGWPASVKCGGVPMKVASAEDSDRYLGRKQRSPSSIG